MRLRQAVDITIGSTLTIFMPPRSVRPAWRLLSWMSWSRWPYPAVRPRNSLPRPRSLAVASGAAARCGVAPAPRGGRWPCPHQTRRGISTATCAAAVMPCCGSSTGFRSTTSAVRWCRPARTSSDWSSTSPRSRPATSGTPSAGPCPTRRPGSLTTPSPTWTCGPPLTSRVSSSSRCTTGCRGMPTPRSTRWGWTPSVVSPGGRSTAAR